MINDFIHDEEETLKLNLNSHKEEYNLIDKVDTFFQDSLIELNKLAKFEDKFNLLLLFHQVHLSLIGGFVQILKGHFIDGMILFRRVIEWTTYGVKIKRNPENFKIWFNDEYDTEKFKKAFRTPLISNKDQILKDLYDPYNFTSVYGVHCNKRGLYLYLDVKGQGEFQAFGFKYFNNDYTHTKRFLIWSIDLSLKVLRCFRYCIKKIINTDKWDENYNNLDYELRNLKKKHETLLIDRV